MRIYERHTIREGLNSLHGLRHQYAQQRYYELTGWKSPAEGGPSKEMLTQNKKTGSPGQVNRIKRIRS